MATGTAVVGTSTGYGRTWVVHKKSVMCEPPDVRVLVAQIRIYILCRYTGTCTTVCPEKRQVLLRQICNKYLRIAGSGYGSIDIMFSQSL